MHALLLALVVAAHAPGPQAALLAPHGKDLQGLRAFLVTASSQAPALSPGPLGRALGTALAVDALDPASWPEAGLDPDAPASALLYRGSAAALVVGVHDRAKVVARAIQSLPSAGEVTRDEKGGVTLLVARRPAGDVGAAVAISNKRAALWLGGADPSFLRGALTARPPSARTRGLAGTLMVVSALGAAGLQPSSTALAIDARIQNRDASLVAAPHDRFGALKLDGAIVARADLGAPALAVARGQTEALLRLLLNRAGAPLVNAQLPPLLGELAGPVALLVTSLDPDRGQGATEVDAYFLASHVYAAQVKDAARAKAALESLLDALNNGKDGLAEAPSAVPGVHRKLQVAPNRTLYFGLADDVLYVANDAPARDALLGALATSTGKAAHAGTLVVDGARCASALGRLSILDAARSGSLAALFGLAVEGGPLVRATGTTTFVADPEPGGLRVRGTVNVAPLNP